MIYFSVVKISFCIKTLIYNIYLKVKNGEPKMINI